jgi:hypothetical protein
MKRLQCSIGLLAAILAVLALDLAVIRSLTRCQPGSSNTWLYLVPIDGTRWVTFLTFSVGVLPMASVLVLATISHALTIRRGGTVSTRWIGFVAFGWLSVFLFMVVAALSPPAIDEYLFRSGNLIAPAVIAALGESPPDWLVDVLEVIHCVVVLTLPEVLIAMAGAWLIGRSGGRVGVEGRAPGATVRYPGRSLGAADA